jgi:hypothetical protein
MNDRRVAGFSAYMRPIEYDTPYLLSVTDYVVVARDGYGHPLNGPVEVSKRRVQFYRHAYFLDPRRLATVAAAGGGRRFESIYTAVAAGGWHVETRMRVLARFGAYGRLSLVDRLAAGSEMLCRLQNMRYAYRAYDQQFIYDDRAGVMGAGDARSAAPPPAGHASPDIGFAPEGGDPFIHYFGLSREAVEAGMILEAAEDELPPPPRLVRSSGRGGAGAMSASVRAVFLDAADDVRIRSLYDIQTTCFVNLYSVAVTDSVRARLHVHHRNVFATVIHNAFAARAMEAVLPALVLARDFFPDVAAPLDAGVVEAYNASAAGGGVVEGGAEGGAAAMDVA